MIKEIVRKFVEGITIDIDGIEFKKGLPSKVFLDKTLKWKAVFSRFFPIMVHNNQKYWKKLRQLRELRQTPTSPHTEIQSISSRMQ